MSWSDEHTEYLVQHYGTVEIAEIAVQLGKTPESVKQRAKRLSLCRSRTQRRMVERDGNTIRIPLHSKKHKGLWAVISREDLGLVAKHRWHPVPGSREGMFYACSTINKKQVLMHRLILPTEGEEIVDHKDGDCLNNQRHNLRPLTRRKNVLNRHRSDKGMGIEQVGRNWRVKHSRRVIGYFRTKEQAARAYDRAVYRGWGELAGLNYPGETEGYEHQLYFPWLTE